MLPGATCIKRQNVFTAATVCPDTACVVANLAPHISKRAQPTPVLYLGLNACCRLSDFSCIVLPSTLAGV